GHLRVWTCSQTLSRTRIPESKTVGDKVGDKVQEQGRKPTALKCPHFSALSAVHLRELLILAGFITFLAGLDAAASPPQSPIGVTASLETASNAPLVRVSFTVPPEHVVY